MTLVASSKVIPQNPFRFLRHEIEFNCNRASVPEGHFRISEWLAQGVSVADVSKWVGTSEKEIHETYKHWIKEAEDRLDEVQKQAWLAQGLDENELCRILWGFRIRRCESQFTFTSPVISRNRCQSSPGFPSRRVC